MSLTAPGPHEVEDKEADNEENAIEAAIDRATADCKPEEPLMTQLCKISAEIDRAKKKTKAEKEGKTWDPRVPYDVLVQEGISPNLGPRVAVSRRRGGKLSVAKATVFAMIVHLIGSAHGCNMRNEKVQMTEKLHAKENLKPERGREEGSSKRSRESKKSGCLAAGGPEWDISAGTAGSKEDLKIGRGLEAEGSKQQDP